MVKPGYAVITAMLGLLLSTAACSSNDSSKDADKAASTSPSTISTHIDKSDAYKIGCPALDGALGAGSLARKAAAAVLGGLASSGSVSADQKDWLSNAKKLLQTSKPDDVPGTVRNRVKTTCSDAGHPLSNL